MGSLENRMNFNTFLDIPSKIAGDVKFEPFASGGGLIELPEYQKSQFRLDIAYKALQALPRVREEQSDPRALGVVGSSYLMFTDIEATQEQEAGWEKKWLEY